MLGQPASWQTVCRPSRCTSPRSWVNCGPMLALTLIHGGLRSMGVSELRASMRRRRRPSGALLVVEGADCSMVTKLRVRRDGSEAAGQRGYGDEGHVGCPGVADAGRCRRDER